MLNQDSCNLKRNSLHGLTYQIRIIQGGMKLVSANICIFTSSSDDSHKKDAHLPAVERKKRSPLWRRSKAAPILDLCQGKKEEEKRIWWSKEGEGSKIQDKRSSLKSYFLLKPILLPELHCHNFQRTLSNTKLPRGSVLPGHRAVWETKILKPWE